MLTNIERERAGVPPLLWDSALRDIARSHSRYMAENDYFAHENKEADRVTERGIKAGYHCVKPATIGLGENIAMSSGPFVPEETVRQWMGSPGHRENMLDVFYDRIGIGFTATRPLPMAKLSTPPWCFARRVDCYDNAEETLDFYDNIYFCNNAHFGSSTRFWSRRDFRGKGPLWSTFTTFGATWLLGAKPA